MDSLTVVELARRLIDVDSTTGREGTLGREIAELLRGRGWNVVEQEVTPGRFNVLATADPPRVVLSTHFDCVPPFLPSAVRDGLLYGRGACDAKGILASQWLAAERLRDDGERRVGLLFVVGEERGSDGAKAANSLSSGARFLINGEPTDSRLAAATRGVLRLRLRARGRAAHSSHPELGESAIEKLIDALLMLRRVPLPDHPMLGRTHYTVGLISGGVAPNVVPAAAEAEVMFRTVGPAADLVVALAPLERLVTLEQVLEVPPVRMHTVAGFETAVFPYTTDIPFLTDWGRPLLFGPGSVLVAHSDEEHVRIDELERAVDQYVKLTGTLLQSTS